MVWCGYQIWKALWKNLTHEFQKDSLKAHFCPPLNLEGTACAHCTVLFWRDSFLLCTVELWNFFCKFYHQAPRIQLHFPSWALSVSSWILVLVDWISGAVITSWWLRLGGKKKPKTFAYSWKDALSVAADEEFTSQPHTLHLTWVQHKAHLPLSSSWLLCCVRLLVSLTVLVWMQTAPPVAKALLCGSHCMPA